MSDFPVKITSQLYVSDIGTVREQELDVDRAISVCHDTAADNCGCKTGHVRLADLAGTSSDRAYCNYETFERAVAEVLAALADKDTVCVYCHAGQSRSPAVSLAALARYNKWSYETAQEAIHQAHMSILSEPMEAFAKTYVITHVGELRASPE